MPTTERERIQAGQGPPEENPTGSDLVRQWIQSRVAADGPMREAAARRTTDPGTPGSDDAGMDALMVLTRQHNQVNALVKQLSAIPGHAKGGTGEDLSQRKSIVDLITVYLSGHEAAEEAYLWPAVREVLPDGDRWAEGALAQEAEGKDTLTALGKLDPGTDEFDSLAAQLVAQLRKHVAYEEQVFHRLRAAMPDREREKLGRKLFAAARRGPTRPHPHAPAKPAAAAKAAAAGAAPLDKARDLMDNRPAARRGKPE